MNRIESSLIELNQIWSYLNQPALMYTLSCESFWYTDNGILSLTLLISDINCVIDNWRFYLLQAVIN